MDLGLGGLKLVIQVLYERQIVALQIIHVPAHAGEALTEPEIVGGIGLGGFSLCPVPVAPVLEIHHMDVMTADGRALVLEA